MRTINFAKRNFKELIRDPLSIAFLIILPLFLLFIFQQFKIPNDVYSLNNFTPSIIVFSFTFIALFTSALIARDRQTSLLIRLGVSPMKSYEYILGYTLSILPIVILQNIVFFILAIILGLSFSISIIYTILASLIISLLFISLGVLIGSMVKEKAANGVSSALVQVVCFTSGMYFSNDMIGKGYAKVCDYLPFKACIDILRGILNNNTSLLSLHNILVLLFYILLVMILAIVIFKKKMVSDNK